MLLVNCYNYIMKGFKLLFLILIIAFSLYTGEASAATPVKILIVPGHDNEVWGAQYGNVKEAAMNLAVGTRLYDILKADGRFEVYVTRDKDGYVETFANYFKNERENIIQFKDNAKKTTQAQIASGNFTPIDGVPHNKVNEDTSVILYGINKWANENKMDAIIHIHVNDEARKTIWKVGKFTGFSVYTPGSELVNWWESGQLAANIFLKLKEKYSTSTYKPEQNGLVPDMSLIAMGSNRTLDKNVRTVLIEYGYISQKLFRNYNTRHKAYNDMAKLTASGIKNYFFTE